MKSTIIIIVSQPKGMAELMRDYLGQRTDIRLREHDHMIERSAGLKALNQHG